MSRVLAACVAAVLIAGLAGCGGGSSSPSSATSSASVAMLTVRQTRMGLLGLSASPEHLLRLEVPVEFANGSSVGCNVNFVRLQIFDATDLEVERAEVTADDIVALGGTNRVVRGSPVGMTLVFDFNTVEFPRAALTAEGRDDNGNTVTRALTSLELELAPELQEGA